MTWFDLIIQIKLIYFNSLVNKFVVRFIIQVVISKQIGVWGCGVFEVVGSIPTDSNIFFQIKNENVDFFFSNKKRCTGHVCGPPQAHVFGFIVTHHLSIFCHIYLFFIPLMWGFSLILFCSIGLMVNQILYFFII